MAHFFTSLNSASTTLSSAAARASPFGGSAPPAAAPAAPAADAPKAAAPAKAEPAKTAAAAKKDAKK